MNEKPKSTQTIDPIPVIEAWNLGFHSGTALTHLFHAAQATKTKIEHLKQAQWFIEREIRVLKAQDATVVREVQKDVGPVGRA